MLEDHVLSKLSSTPFQLSLGDFMFHIYHIFVEHHVFQSMLRYIFMIYTFHCPLGHFEVSGMNGFFYNLSFIGYLNLNLSVKKEFTIKIIWVVIKTKTRKKYVTVCDRCEKRKEDVSR